MMKMGPRNSFLLLSILLYAIAAIRAEHHSLSDGGGGGGNQESVWPTDSDLENELEKRVKNIGWSGWSEWSTCSRSCDGGVAQQLRRCHAPNGCRGEPVRYKICNMQSCPDVQDFRAHQCAAYDEVPYEGQLYKWMTHYDYSEPCALTCRGRPTHLPSDDGEAAVGSDGQSEDEPIIVVQLSKRVQDGTRCRMGSLDMCIQGKCQRVGCDLKIGSAKKVDACGVCGGDGGSCSQPLYQWEIAPMSLCSVTCGGGYKMSRPVCRNRVTGGDLEDSLCSAATRPEPAVIQCNTHMCPPKWINDEWSTCSKTCGSGMRQRAVVCAEEANGVKHNIPDDACRSAKPAMIESCNMGDCPKWIIREWSGCSVSCGSGIQVRKIECVDSFGTLSSNCEAKMKPSATQPCSTGMLCNGPTSTVATTGTTIGTTAHVVVRASLTVASSAAVNQRPGVENAYENSEEPEEDEEEEVDQAGSVGESKEDDEETSAEISAAKYRKSRESAQHRAFADDPRYRPRPQHLTKSFVHHEERAPVAASLVDGGPDNQPVPSEATFIKDTDWSTCSVTCGEGIRRKFYRCKIFLELSRTVATLRNESHCSQPKPPPDVERCTMEPCSMAYGYDDSYLRDSIKVGVSEPGKTYIWKEQGYTSCSASCLGGVEELIVNCVREDTDKVVSPFLCSPETKPEARIRTCNDRPCPPRWKYSEYSPCSKSCGIGIREREVQCIHEVTRGGENTMVVPNNMCPQPPPLERQYCNVLDCPVRWEVFEWSKCSKTCGTGFKERRVECKQIMAQEHTVERRPELCPSIKPQTRKPCNTKACAPEDQHPPISASNTSYIQHDWKKTKVTLKIGGAATLFLGTQVKIKCPVKRYNRTKIRWSRNDSFLGKSKKFKVSKKGALRILDLAYSDTAVYACHAGLSVEKIKITVKKKPGDPDPTSEDYEDKYDYGRKDASLPLLTDGTSTGQKTKQQQQPQQQQRDRNKNNRNRQKGSGDNMRQSDGNAVADNPNELEQLTADSAQSVASSGSRTVQMPAFQHLLSSIQFLWPFQSFSHSKGHQMLVDNGLDLQYALDRLESEDQPFGALGGDSDTMDFHANGNITVLGSGTRENVKFEWMITPWTECSQKCGTSTGFKNRKAHCMVKLNNATQSVDNVLCEDAGLSVPDTVERCGQTECPHWLTSEWPPCKESRCLSHHTSVQKRDVWCGVATNETLPDERCEEEERPVPRQECYNSRCAAAWRVEPWSECNAPCGGQGFKYRILQCVWHGSKRPAGTACKELPRPAVMKVCKGAQCVANNYVDCTDTSRYCTNVRSMGLCRLHRYQQKCCQSCRPHLTHRPSAGND